MATKKKKLPSRWWNYRIIKRSRTKFGFTETWCEVVEAHYEKKKSKTIPVALSGPIPLVGDTKKEILDMLARIKKALKKPLLDEKRFPEK